MGKQAKELKYILSVADYLLEDLLDTGFYQRQRQEYFKYYDIKRRKRKNT